MIKEKTIGNWLDDAHLSIKKQSDEHPGWIGVVSIVASFIAFVVMICLFAYGMIHITKAIGGKKGVR